jgi:hypothetical protein
VVYYILAKKGKAVYCPIERRWGDGEKENGDGEKFTNSADNPVTDCSFTIYSQIPKKSVTNRGEHGLLFIES